RGPARAQPASGPAPRRRGTGHALRTGASVAPGPLGLRRRGHDARRRGAPLHPRGDPRPAAARRRRRPPLLLPVEHAGRTMVRHLRAGARRGRAARRRRRGGARLRRVRLQREHPDRGPHVGPGGPRHAPRRRAAEPGARGAAAAHPPAPVLVEGPEVGARLELHPDPGARLLGGAGLPPPRRRLARGTLLLPGVTPPPSTTLAEVAHTVTRGARKALARDRMCYLAGIGEGPTTPGRRG